MEALNRQKKGQAAQGLEKYLYHAALANLSSEEKFKLTSKRQYASFRISANAAEGYGLSVFRDTVRSCCLTYNPLMGYSSHLVCAVYADEGI